MRTAYFETIVCHCFKQCERAGVHLVDALLEAVAHRSYRSDNTPLTRELR